MNCKIALYGFGSLPVVYRHLIELAVAEKTPINWCVILTTPNYREIMGEVLPKADILDVFQTLPRVPVGGNLSCLAGYPGSLVEDLAAQKRARRKRTRDWLHNRGIDYYKLYKSFLIDRGATHILMSGIETPDAKIAVAAAQELGLGIIAPVDLRNLTGTFFSKNAYETPPNYALANPTLRVQAAQFVNEFRQSAAPARALPADFECAADDHTVLPDYLPPLWKRLAGFVGTVAERPDIFDHDLVRVSVMNNFDLLRTTIRGVRARRNAPQYDIADVNELPERFIFYPLQYTPESSINVPAPYFVDQLRVVDAVRYSMPSDYTLVLKEHPACVEMRPVAFMRRLRTFPGVTVVKATIPSTDVIRRAALTVTVTGTAALEALLLGRPALVLGPGLPAWALGHRASVGRLREEIPRAVQTPPTDDFVIEQIARLLSVRYPFYFSTAHLPGEPMLRLGNMRRFLKALTHHLDRERSLKEHAA